MRSYRRAPRQHPAVWLAANDTGQPPAEATAAPRTKHGTPLEPGDIICFPDDKGVIATVIPGGYSHVAMYIGDGKMIEATVSLDDLGPDPSTWHHAAGEVRITDAPSDYSNLTVLRVKGLDDDARKRAVDFAKSKEGLPYDYQWLAPLVGGKQLDGPSYYCSELVWAAYMTQNVDLDANSWNFECGRNVSPQEIVDDSDTVEI